MSRFGIKAMFKCGDVYHIGSGNEMLSDITVSECRLFHKLDDVLIRKISPEKVRKFGFGSRTEAEEALIHFQGKVLKVWGENNPPALKVVRLVSELEDVVHPVIFAGQNFYQ